LLQNGFIPALFEILVSVLIILKVNVNLSKLIPELLLTGTHPPVASIKHHNMFQLMIHQVHDQVIIVFGLRECLSQREQLPKAHPLRLLIFGYSHVSFLEMLEQLRVSLQVCLDVDLGTYQSLN
jgi:hypothetical protein